MGIDQIKSKISIVDAISRAIEVERGTNGKYKAKCPFHDDKSPSLVINEKKGFYFCFGCQCSGDVFNFYQEYYKLSFNEAFLKLKDLYNLGGEPVRRSNYLYELNDLVVRLYIKNSTNQLSSKFSEFLTLRNLSQETASKFSLGIAGGSDQISNYISKFTDIKKRELWLRGAVELGIIREVEGKYYDAYKNRIIFPIFDIGSKVVGFSTRKISNDQGGPKYLNSPGSLIFKKSNILYGENLLKPSGSEDRKVILVEGFMDVIKLHQAGIKNAVGLMGVSLDSSKVKPLLSRYGTVYLALDSDEAGKRASEKISTQFLTELYLPKVIELSPCKDPDEFVDELGGDEFVERLLGAEVGVRVRS